METCERHGEIAKCLDEHEKRITSLEISDAKILEKIESLTDSIKELVGWLKVAVIGMCGVGASFIVWYIQNLQV